MTKRGSGNRLENRFAEVYNDVRNYPTLEDVAKKLGRSVKTVKNYAGILRRRAQNDKSLPLLISRATLKSRPDPMKMTNEEIAEVRARTLRGEMLSLFQSSDYPVVNPEALVTVPSRRYRTDRFTGRRYQVKEGSSRTWLSDTLRVEPIIKPAWRRFIFTGAQNDTAIHKPFWDNLKAYAEHINAAIVVGPWTYETNWWDENTPASRDYDEHLAPHLCFGQMQIGQNFMFAGEMNTLPTATRPISDLANYSRGRWAVFPHARLQLLSVPAINPVDQSYQIMTTGAVTRPQVIPRKAGIESIDNHVIGATLVEFDDAERIFPRQLIADEDGSFQDLDCLVRNGKVYTGVSVEAFTAADIHIAKMNRRNALGTFGFDYETGETQSDSMIEVLRPDWLFLHDIHDHESRSHHDREDVSHNFEMAYRGRESVAEEVQRSADFLAKLRGKVGRVAVVESNHDLALERYIREGRYRMDGCNFRYGLRLDAAYHDWVVERSDAVEKDEQPPRFSLLEWAVRDMAERKLDHVSWVYDNDTCVVNGVQLGFHGFRGINGAKGTMTGFAKMGHAITIGDKHSPGILDRVYCAGVMELEQGYNKGPGSWATAHVVQYHNGKRAIITMQDGRWRA